eukprot:GHVT01040191.1.p2 GENE.GHVT01040191.1~~GHVT01040191.1.p2  ORF type:complete len:130 (-),score=7.96 GHVT01040191.1:1623-2012(-)
MNTNTTCAGVDVDACEPNETCDICVGCFVPLLEEVDLSFNKICGVADLKQFRKASALWSLALAGNSVLHIQNFRSLLIKALPQLRYIDGRKLPLIEVAQFSALNTSKLLIPMLFSPSAPQAQGTTLSTK